MNIFELLGINNPETFVPIFVAVLVAEIILVILVFRLFRVMKRKKAEKELRQKRMQRLKEIQAAKARKEAEVAKKQREAEAVKKQQEAEEKAQREAKERAVRERQEAEAKAAKAQEEAKKGADHAETEAIAKVEAEVMAEKEAAEKAAKELQEAEAKSAKAQREAEEKASKEQQEAEEKTVKDRQKEAEERISKAQKEAQEKIARARQEAEEAFKVQKKDENAAQEKAEEKVIQAAEVPVNQDEKVVEEEKMTLETAAEDLSSQKADEVEEKKASKEGTEEPVISVQNVTMVFNVATRNVSGLKEYVIQKVEKKISHRKFKALNNISFDVFKGEVVGIIGTNGSGKSTILRIVSGALRPTSGRVVVDKKKVQLLTLGTGFDFELTARENVYLNGSIIGYSRSFIDQHYDEIVEFAELQDFMEEKVKNFSSGMVSRLGFAIATAGGAAEILILDEVLSVGDEFFRKKSLAKIQEMIHGGSTVLMVSHNMNTIQQNCSKVVWIEKGDLRMIGSPKEVCAAYSKMHAE